MDDAEIKRLKEAFQAGSIAWLDTHGKLRRIRRIGAPPTPLPGDEPEPSECAYFHGHTGDYVALWLAEFNDFVAVRPLDHAVTLARAITEAIKRRQDDGTLFQVDVENETLDAVGSTTFRVIGTGGNVVWLDEKDEVSIRREGIAIAVGDDVTMPLAKGVVNALKDQYTLDAAMPETLQLKARIPKDARVYHTTHSKEKYRADILWRRTRPKQETAEERRQKKLRQKSQTK